MQFRIFINVIKKAKKPKRRSVSSKRIRRIKLLYIYQCIKYEILLRTLYFGYFTLWHITYEDLISIYTYMYISHVNQSNREILNSIFPPAFPRS